jgi:hypothetical protein
MKLFCDIVAIISARNHIKENDDPFSKIILTMYFDMFVNSPIVFTTRTKFDYYDTIFHNQQLSESVKSAFFLEFYQSQKIYWTLSNFAHKYRVYQTY